jgi:iron complex transport system ATP-binding protein
MLNLTHLLPHPCVNLSSGESQRLLLASALLHHAHYTLFDEPTANLDPQTMKRVFEIIKEPIPQHSKIIITHNLDLAYQLGFDILLLQDHTIAFRGSCQTFFRQEILDQFYKGSVKNHHQHIVVSL